eukprot:g2648.t1
MVKVVPTEQGGGAEAQQGTEAQRSPELDAEQQQPTDDHAEVQPTIPTTACASTVQEGHRSNGTVSDTAEPESDVELSPPRSTNPSKKPSEGEETNHEANQPESGALATADESEAMVSNTKDAAPALDMDKHSGMTTFSLMRQDDESNLEEPDAWLGSHPEEGDEASNMETLKEGTDESEKDDSEFAPTFARRNTGIARKLVRQNTGVGIAGGSSTGGKKKKAPFRVPQTMFQGHPVGSPAAEFLERQHHRLAEIRARREEVAGLLELVMEHNPKSTGSSLPDIDAVFPDRRERELSQGDYCV